MTKTIITDLYIALFNRAPGADGLHHWVNQVDNEGLAVETVANTFFITPEGQAAYPASLNSELYVKTIFSNALGRELDINNPDDAEGLTFWIDQIESGAILREHLPLRIIQAATSDTANVRDKAYITNKTEVALAFSEVGLNGVTNSTEVLEDITVDPMTVIEGLKKVYDLVPSTETMAFVSELYIAMFNRAPGKDGLLYWTDQIRHQGLTAEAVTNTFFATPEGQAAYPNSLSTEAYVQRIFNNALGRTLNPENADDVEGLAFWVDQVDNGTIPRETLVLRIIQAATSDTANVRDKAYLNNKTDIALAFSIAGLNDINATIDILADVSENAGSVMVGITKVYALTHDGFSATYQLTINQDIIRNTYSDDDTVIGINNNDSALDTFTEGDIIDTGNGYDILKLSSNTSDVDLSIASLSNIEKLVVDHETGNWDRIDIANLNFDAIILNEGGALSSGLSVENINTSTAISVTNVKANDEDHSISFTTDNVSTEGNVVVTLSDIDLSSANESFSVDAIFTEASRVHTTINLTDISDLGNNNGGEYIHSLSTGAKINVGTETVFNIKNLTTTDKFGVGLLIEQVDGAENNIIVDLDNTDNVGVKVLLQNIGNNTSFTDRVTLNLDEVANSNSEAAFSSVNVEELNVNVISDSEMDVIGSSFVSRLDVEEETASVNLDLNADLVVRQWDFNTNTESTEFNINRATFATPGSSLDPLIDVAFNITGSGNITIAELNLGNIYPFSNTQVDVNGSSATGNIRLAKLSLDVRSVITGSGNDLVTVGSSQMTVATNGGNDYVNTHGFHFGLADEFVLDGGSGEDTIAINNGSHLVTGVMQHFEILDASGGRGTYDMENIAGLRDVIISDGIQQSIVLDNVQKQSVLTLNAFAKNGSYITINQEDKTGVSGTLSVRLNAVDSDDDSNTSGETDAHLIVNNYETIRLTSDATIGSQNSTMQPSDYTNSVILDASDMTDLLISGNAHTDLHFINSTALININATGSLSGINFDFNSTTSAISFVGSQGADTITVPNHDGNFIQGSRGADTINLNTGTDIIRYTSKESSPLVLTETETSGFDIITGFTRGSDVIQLFSTLGLGSNESHFSMLQKGSIANQNSENSMQNFIGDGIEFFSDTSFNRATAFAENGTDGYLFIDVNNDGNFSTHADMVIQLSGVIDLGILDIQFG